MPETATPATKTEAVHDEPVITITDEAAEKLAEQMAEHDDAQALRLLVQEGCCGFGYAMAMADRDPEEAEIHVEANGIDVYLDDATLEMVQGASVAWTEGVFGAGFTIDNPNEPDDASCGC